MYSPTWLITFHRNAFYAHEINGKLFVYMGNFTFKIRARAVRHVIAITRELPLGQWLTFINRANPRKNIPTCCALGIARRGETTHSGVDVNNTHPSMINPLNNHVHEAWIVVTRGPYQYKDSFSGKGNFHYKDKTVVRPSCLYNGNSCTGKTTSLYWDGSQSSVSSSVARPSYLSNRNPSTGNAPS